MILTLNQVVYYWNHKGLFNIGLFDILYDKVDYLLIGIWNPVIIHGKYYLIIILYHKVSRKYECQLKKRQKIALYQGIVQ